jgi:hypothetical protein
VVKVNARALAGDGARELINRLTGEPNSPARTANQYLARYWFAVRADKIGSPVRRDIGSRFTPVKLVHWSGDLST